MKSIYGVKMPKVELTDLKQAFIRVNEKEIEVDENIMNKDMLTAQGATYEPHIVTKYEYDEELIYLETYSEEGALEAVKNRKLAKIDEYDTSDNVNVFYLNGMKVWLDKDTRVGLMNSTNIAKNDHKETTTLWLGSNKLVINCDLAIQLLSKLEMYALECFNITASHKKEVSEMTDIETIYNYDYKVGYPEPLVMNTNNA